MAREDLAAAIRRRKECDMVDRPVGQAPCFAEREVLYKLRVSYLAHHKH